MIVVLADDFTGAAEVAAIGRRYGLTAEVQTAFRETERADLVVVDTHTRSASRSEAERRIAEELRRLRQNGVERMHFKKVDSVLRGHVTAELCLVLESYSELDRVLLVPFNPSFGQRICGGRYCIAGRPLNETRFASDPEYPARTADILELLEADNGTPVVYRDEARLLPRSGIVVPAGTSRDDLIAFARHLDPRTLPAGGGDFFDVLLQVQLGRIQAAPPAPPSQPAADHGLIVLGSVTSASRLILGRARQSGVPIITIPPDIDPWSQGTHRSLQSLAEAVLDCLTNSPRVLVTADGGGEASRSAPLRIRLIPELLARVTRIVLDHWSGALDLYVSGGTSASAIVRLLEWHSLRVAGELGRGVVTLTAAGRPDRSLTVKPGSYPWPEPILQALE